jgi:stage II sporulation protein AA (anti-sigma F factor antagonist)
MVPLQMGRDVVQESPRVIVFHLAGDVDYLNVQSVETRFQEILETDRPRHLLLDVSGLTFVVTPFLGSLLFWEKELQQRGGRLVLFGVRPSIEHPMRVLRLHRVLTFCPDQQAALDALPREG